MDPKQAIQVIEQIRLKAVLSGGEADLFREAVIALNALVNRPLQTGSAESKP